MHFSLEETKQNEIIIIGGGLAGLSTAVHAIDHGFRPIILEDSRYLGGRARSFFAPDIQSTIDNGQHVLSAAYKETIQFLKKIGSSYKVHFQKRFSAHFVKDVGNQLFFHAYLLPAPWHFFLPLLKKKYFTGARLKDFLYFFRKNLTVSLNELKKMTVKEWLELNRQNQDIVKFLWEPITLSIMNTPIEKASAYLLNKAISQSFLHSPKNASLGIPRDWLSEIFANPAEKYIVNHGGSIYRSNPVLKLIAKENHIAGIISKHHQFDTPWIICTIPPYSLVKLIRNSQISEFKEIYGKLTGIEYSPIITINIFLKKQLDINTPISPVNSPIHWIFPHPRKESRFKGYSLVISAAKEWSNKPNDEILRMAQSELLRLMGVDISGKNLLNYKIVKEKRATILQTPESLKLRLPAKTRISNLFFAGDWTDTGLPATIEGAIRSGRLAIEALLHQRANQS